MNLRTYLRGQKESMAGFAARLTAPCSQAQISRICSGQCIPLRELMIAIFVATEGAVTPNDLFLLPDIHGSNRTCGNVSRERESQAA
jgi:hypothetical protein